MVNSWPVQKRKAAQSVIEWDLKTYKAMKADIEEMEKDIEDEAAPAATDIRENIYVKSKEMYFKGGFNTSVTIGHLTRNAGDPTVSKAEAVRRLREQKYAATEFKEMIRRINAIERVLERLEQSEIPNDKLKAKLVKMKYFEQNLTDSRIADELHIGVRTLYKWQDGVIEEIAHHLGFIA